MPFGQCIFPKPSAAVFCQASSAKICRARFSARCLAATSLGPLRPFGFALRAQATRRLRRGRISLVRSTFGLRDFPPNRRVAAHLRRICGGRRPLSFVSARKAGEAGREPREGGGRFCEFGTTPRTINRPRGLRLFSRRRDAARTLRGRFAHGERIVLAPVRARVGHLQGRCGDGASGAVGV